MCDTEIQYIVIFLNVIHQVSVLFKQPAAERGTVGQGQYLGFIDKIQQNDVWFPGRSFISPA